MLINVSRKTATSIQPDTWIPEVASYKRALAYFNHRLICSSDLPRYSEAVIYHMSSKHLIQLHWNHYFAFYFMQKSMFNQEVFMRCQNTENVGIHVMWLWCDFDYIVSNWLEALAVFHISFDPQDYEKVGLYSNKPTIWNKQLNR